MVPDDDEDLMGRNGGPGHTGPLQTRQHKKSVDEDTAALPPTPHPEDEELDDDEEFLFSPPDIALPPTPSPSLGVPSPPSSVCSSSSSLRFPATAPSDKKETIEMCRWKGCGVILDQNASLLEHIQAVHVEGQLQAESFCCLWVGCKVFEKTSCSVSWLERHVLLHGGPRPFKCIVDGCGLRFTSQNALGRHVNHHFSVALPAPTAKPPSVPSPTKLIKKNGRKLRYRKRPWSARTFDFFDVGIMERVRWKLVCAAQVSTWSISSSVDAESITLSSRVVARRTSSKGEERLVRWHPQNILPDEWVNPSSVEVTRIVPLKSLSPEGKRIVAELCYPNLYQGGTCHKRKRSVFKKEAFS